MSLGIGSCNNKVIDFNKCVFSGVSAWSKKYRVTVLVNNGERLKMLKTEPSEFPKFKAGSTKRIDELKFPHILNLFTNDNPGA